MKRIELSQRRSVDKHVLAMAEQDPFVIVLSPQSRTVLVLVLVLDGSSSIAASRLSGTLKKHAAVRFLSLA